MAQRRNLCPVPAVADATNWSGYNKVRVTEPGFDRTYSIRTNGDANYSNGYVRCPAVAALPGEVWSASLSFKTTKTVECVVNISFHKSSGFDAGSASTSRFLLSAGVVDRRGVTTTAPSETASVKVGVTFYDLGSSSAYATMALLERTDIVEPYGDGDSTGWVWDGVAGTSTSTGPTPAPVEATATISDAVAEALPVDVSYVPDADPADVVVEALPVAQTHPQPAETAVEALPVSVTHHVATEPTETTVEAAGAVARGTNPDPDVVVVEALGVTVGIAGQLPSRRAPLVGLALPPSRVLAQSILTGQWLSWDLPVSDLEITWTLSGPTTISGSFAPEITGLTDLGLEAWGTWIHIEDSGIIRASGILQPTSLEGETLSLEAVGPSGYAARIPYRGVFSGIQVDPADMVRHLWTHIQSHPRGDLGITVYGTTPVRIGTPEVDVEFDTAAGEHVSFSAGPYKLEWWNNTLCGREIDQLAGETPFDYLERASWNVDKTDVEHWIDLAHPRIGRRLDGLRFAAAENILEVAPLEEPDNAYASQVYVQGKGEGATTVNGYAGRDVGGRLRLPVVVEDKTVGTVTRARAVASEQLAARQAALVEVPEIAVDVRHPNAPLGSFAPGDEIAPEIELAYVGAMSAWHRITAIRYRPDAEAAALTLTRRSEFADR